MNMKTRPLPILRKPTRLKQRQIVKLYSEGLSTYAIMIETNSKASVVEAAIQQATKP